MKWSNLQLPILSGKDKITILEFINSGVSSQVYKAKDSQNNLYAFKVFKNIQDENQLADEFYLMARMDSRYITKVYEIGTYEKYHYIIMDYFDGDNLSNFIEKNGAFSPNQTLNIVRQIAYALRELHNKLFVHRDIKLDNILINDQLEVRLIDFGLSNQQEKSNKYHNIAGNFLFSSPEQTRSLNRPVDHRSDLYSLGILIFYCLTKNYPFESPHVQELLKLHLTAPVPQIKNFLSDTPDFFQLCINKLLQKDPDNRYQSVNQLIQDLGFFIDNPECGYIPSEKQDNNHIFQEHIGNTSLVEREDEIQKITEIVDSSDMSDLTRIVLLQGLSGCGKSSIVWSFLKKYSEKQKFLFLFDKCLPEAITPFYTIKKIFTKAFDQLSEEEKNYFFDTAVKSQSIFLEDLFRFDPKLFCGFQQREVDPTQNPTRFIGSISEATSILCELFDKTIIFIDDLQWTDRDSLKILTRVLYRHYDSCRITLILTARSESEYTPIIGSIFQDLASKIFLNLTIESLNEEASKNFIKRSLGNKVVQDEIYEWIISQSKSNPFAMKEYINFLLKKKYLYFFWQEWKTKDLLENIHLPDDIVQIVLDRFNDLDALTYHIVGLSALDQDRIDIGVLSHISHLKEEELADILNNLTEENIFIKSSFGYYSFSHDKIYEAASQIISESKKIKYHSSIAKYLMKSSREDLEVSPFRIAYHFRKSDVYQSVESFKVYFKISMISIENHAYQEAENNFDRCKELLQYANEEEIPQIYKYLGIASYNNLNIDKAIKYLHKAIDSRYFSALDKAEMLQILASLHVNIFKPKKSYEYSSRAFKIIGFDTTSFIKSLLSIFKNIDDHDKSRLEHVVQNNTAILGRSLYGLFNTKGILTAMIWCYIFRRRHNMIETSALYSGSLVAVCGVIGLKKLTVFFGKQAMSLAKDPYTKASVLHHIAIGYTSIGRPLLAVQIANDNLRENRKWISPLTARDSLYMIINVYCYQGRFEAAVQAIDAFFNDKFYIDNPINIHFKYQKFTFLSLMGQFKEASALSDDIKYFLKSSEENIIIIAMNFADQALTLFASNDLGHSLDELEQSWVDNFENKYKNIMFHAKFYYIGLAHARFEKCMDVFVKKGTVDDNNLKKTILIHKKLCLAHNKGFFKAHASYIEAGLCMLQGNYKRCSELIMKTRKESEELDIVWLIAACFRLESHLFERTHYKLGLFQAVESCFRVSKQHKLNMIVNKITQEFPTYITYNTVNDFMGSSLMSEIPAFSNSYDAEKIRIKKYLDALLHISTAASKSSDFDQTIYHCIDELINALGAERGCIITIEGSLETYFRRDHAMSTVTDHSDISSSVIEKIKKTLKPVLFQNNIEDLSNSSSIMLQDLKSIIAVPMLLNDEMIGVIYLDSHAVKGLFTDHDVNILQTAANHVAVAIETKRAANLEITRREAIKDLEVTGAVQRLLLPPRSVIESKNYQVHSYFKPAYQSGGDWFWTQDFDNHVLCLIGDVTGHGPGPAMITASIAGAFHAQSLENHKLLKQVPEMIRVFQDCLSQIGQNEYWMSMGVILIDTNNYLLNYWSAGSPPPIILRETGEAVILKQPSSPLGSQDFSITNPKTIPIQKGDKIIMYTDGVYEINNGNHQMTLGKFKKIVAGWSEPLSGDEMIEKILSQVEYYLGGHVQEDDITLIVTEILS